jgi:protein subunit release factor A
MDELEALEAKRIEVEAAMARPETYSDGKAMRRLSREHEDIHARHAEATARWERLSRRIAELKGNAAGSRPSPR